MSPNDQELIELLRQLAHHGDRGRSTRRLLELIRGADRAGAWVAGGYSSCAAWLADVAGVHPGTARDWTAVARRLAGRPIIADALESGALSYSKVRVLLRYQGPAGDAELVAMARERPASVLREDLRW